uniref:RING-type domain-containing protein n=1 Tax=Romanomermis culicivorax TaxID=13658 RepID=A0A915JVS8_ROMCU
MGNCLQSSDSDGANLVPSSENSDEHHHNTVNADYRRQSDERVVVEDYRLSENITASSTVQSSGNVFYPSPGVSRTACQLTEEEQVKIAQRIGLIHHLPVDIFVEASKTDKECIICMMEFCESDPIRFLPCLHTFHVGCIDDWLMRSFTCPSCLEPVDSALLTSYDNQSAIAFTQTAPLSLSQQLNNIKIASSGKCLQEVESKVWEIFIG